MSKTKETVADRLVAALREFIADIAPAGAGAAVADEVVAWPELTEINSMSLADLTEVAEAHQIDLDGMKLSKARTMIATAASIVADDTDDLDDDDVNALAEALDITPSKKVAATIKQLQSYFATEEETTAEEEVTEEETEAEPVAAKKGKGKSKVVEAEAEDTDTAEAASDEADGVDREEVAGEFDDFPDDDEMRERIEAYNEAQDDTAKEIDLPKKDGKPLQAAYRLLVAELVDSDGKVAEWGEPYARDGQAFCCGLPLDEVTVKGQDEDCGKCLVTGKIYTTDDEGDFVEVKKSKK